MPLEAPRPPLDFAELDAVANYGMVIESDGLAQTGDIVRHLFSQPGDVRGQFVDAVNVPIKTRVDLLEAQIYLFEAPVDLLEAPVDLLEASVDLLEVSVDLLKPPVDSLEPLVDLFEPPAMLTEPSTDIAYLLGDFGQQLIDGCDIGAVDPAHAIPRTILPQPLYTCIPPTREKV
jgi:hypothetical protein